MKGRLGSAFEDISLDEVYRAHLLDKERASGWVGQRNKGRSWI